MVVQLTELAKVVVGARSFEANDEKYSDVSSKLRWIKMVRQARTKAFLEG